MCWKSLLRAPFHMTKLNFGFFACSVSDRRRLLYIIQNQQNREKTGDSYWTKIENLKQTHTIPEGVVTVVSCLQRDIL